MKVIIPKDFSGITIGQFIELQNIKSIDSDVIDFMVDFVSTISNLTYKEAANLSVADLRKIYDSLGWFNEGVKETSITERYELDGVMYCANIDISKITANQYVSIMTALKNGTDANLHHIMAALYIPYGKKYDDIPANEVAEKFYKNMPITIAYPLAVFFCNLLKDSMKDINLYLSSQAMSKTRQALKEVAELVQ